MGKDDIDPAVGGRNVGNAFGIADIDGGGFAFGEDGGWRRLRF